MSNNTASTFSLSEGQAALTQPIDQISELTDGFSLNAPVPLVQPMVRILSQWVNPWGNQYMRKEGERNTKGKITGNDSWAANGCLPVCLAMVTRWWFEDNPETTGKLDFPFAGKKDTLDPPEFCQRMFGDAYVPSMKIQVPEKQQADKKKKGFDDPTNEYIVNGTELQRAMRSIKRNDIPGPFNINLTHLRVGFTGELETRKLILQFWLQFGPVIALMRIPGHFVVIDGYRDDKIYICDPGNILVNTKLWATLPEKRAGSSLPPGEPQSGGYVIVNSSQHYKDKSGKFNAPWLMQIQSLDVTFIDPFNLHPEWSNLENVR